MNKLQAGDRLRVGDMITFQHRGLSPARLVVVDVRGDTAITDDGAHFMRLVRRAGEVRQRDNAPLSFPYARYWAHRTTVVLAKVAP